MSDPPWRTAIGIEPGAERERESRRLLEKLKDPAFKPHFGPAAFNSTAGATVIGAREFLIAYNFNLNTRDKKLAHAVAQELREAGKPKRGFDGKIIKDADGKTISVPGRFKECRAVGWYIEEYGRAQISINFTNYKVTPIHVVFDAALEEAAKLGVRITGSELVGLIPLKALFDAGDYYLAKQGKTPGVPERNASTRPSSRSASRSWAPSTSARRSSSTVTGALRRGSGPCA